LEIHISQISVNFSLHSPELVLLLQNSVSVLWAEVNSIFHYYATLGIALANIGDIPEKFCTEDHLIWNFDQFAVSLIQVTAEFVGWNEAIFTPVCTVLLDYF
jgi:hypothetical protein